MSLKNLIVYFFLSLNYVTFAQNNTVTVSGIITDSLKQPLTNVTLIAKPKQERINIKYAISDVNGNYKLQLIKGVAYKLSISHLSYNSIKKELLFFEDQINL